MEHPRERADQVRARRRTVGVRVGEVVIGGGAPVVVQSMTDTDTADVAATAAQARALAEAGSELVRITVNNPDAAEAVPEIRRTLDRAGCRVPLVGDFHYNGDRLLTRFPECARALAKYRINPGNVGFGEKRDERFATMIEAAVEYGRPVRIGVNWGSLDQSLATRLMNENAAADEPRSAAEVTREALVQSALSSAERAESLGLGRDRIVLSCKVSEVQELVAVYRELGRRGDYALHLGLTEAGMGSKGIVASAAALAILLQQGIGDTIRISLTPEPGGERTREVVVAQELLQTMGLRSFTPLVTACPGCGRTTSAFFREHRGFHPGPSPRAHGGVAGALRRGGGHAGRGHGVRGERPRREQAGERRHQPAGNRGAARGPGLHRRGAGRRSSAAPASRTSSAGSSTTTSNRTTRAAFPAEPRRSSTGRRATPTRPRPIPVSGPEPGPGAFVGRVPRTVDRLADQPP